MEKPGCQHHDMRSNSSFIILTLSQPVLALSYPILSYPNNAERRARNHIISIFKSLVWFDQGFNPRGLDSPISKNRRRTLNSFSQRVWSTHLELLGEDECDENSDRGEDRCQEDAHVADVNRYIQEVQDVVEGSRGYHQALKQTQHQ